MTLKHNFSLLFGAENPIIGLIIEVNTNTNHFMMYSLLLIIFVVSSYVFIRKTQDISKSLISSTHIIAILSLILYYGGKAANTIFIDEIFLLGILVIEAVSIALIYYNKKNY